MLFIDLKNDPNAKEYVQSFTFYVEHAARVELRDMLVHKIRHFFSDKELESSTVIRELEEKGLAKGREEGIKGREEGIEIGIKVTKLLLSTKKPMNRLPERLGCQ